VYRVKLVFTPARRGADYQVRLDGTEVAAAWKKTVRESRKAYIPAKLDPVFLAAPVNCALTAQEDDSSLVWGRDEWKQDLPTGRLQDHLAGGPFPFSSRMRKG
jgi:uncharacterized protein (DUF736 family)